MYPCLTFVSVVLPTFNRAATILRAVESVLNQTHTDLELIVVDDGSTDETESLLMRASDPQIRYVKLARNRGQSLARNTGIRMARGELVAFQDSDDSWHPEKLERQIKRLNEDREAGGIYCDLLRICRASAPFVMSAQEPAVGRLIDRERSTYQTYGIGIQSCLLRKAVIHEAGGFWESLPAFEDLELLLRIARRRRLLRISMPLTNYYETNGVSTDPVAERQARAMMLRRYGLRIACYSPAFVLQEIRKVRELGFGDATYRSLRRWYRRLTNPPKLLFGKIAREGGPTSQPGQ